VGRRFRLPAPALVALGLGAGLALAAQLTGPSPVPLYDGVPTLDPYRYLSPAAGQPGDPTSYEASRDLANGTSRTFVASTTEQPPQAQLIALDGAFVPPAGATAMNVSIDPVPPDVQPTTGAIAGNVYRFAFLADDGADFTVAAGAQPTITLRTPEGIADAVIGHLTPDGWVALVTSHGGAFGLFQAQVAELGDYALLTGVSPPSDLGRLLAIVLTIGVPMLVAIAYFVRRARRAQRAAAEAVEASRAKARIPSKRRRRR
jgi:hypothetical protein